MDDDQHWPERDTVLRTATATFCDIDQFHGIQRYAVMRDAAYTMEATKRALRCLMTAAFVAMSGKISAEGRPIRYFAFAQCDSEAVIRDTLTIGGSGEFLFDASKGYAVRPQPFGTSTNFVLYKDMPSCGTLLTPWCQRREHCDAP